MSDSRITRVSLLIRLRNDRDARAWEEFVEIYTPLVYGYLRRRGLQDADSADVTQDVFRTVARSMDRFDCDPGRGSFRGWLFSIVRSRLSDFQSASKRQPCGSGDTGLLAHLEEQAANQDGQDVWEREYRRGLFDWAARQVRDNFRDSTWDAFWRTSVEGEDTKSVADSLQLSEGAVYIAKCRVLARIKQTIQEIEHES